MKSVSSSVTTPQTPLPLQSTSQEGLEQVLPSGRYDSTQQIPWLFSSFLPIQTADRPSDWLIVIEIS
jgi:hypothetical protein